MRGWLFMFFLIIFRIQGQYTTSWFSMDNGLPQNSIKDITKDRYGFIWLSTDNGIVRYDGAGFLTYNQLPVNNFHFTNFYGDIQNDSIIVYNAYEENKILITKRSPQVIKKRYGNNSGKVFYQAGKTLTPTKITELEANRRYFVKTAPGDYYIYRHQVIYTDKQTGKKVFFSLSESDIYSIFICNETLFIMDPVNRETHRIFSGKKTTDKAPTIFNDPASKVYWQQSSGQVFIVNNDRIYLVDSTKNRLRLILLAQYKNFENYRFGCLYYDAGFGRLYLGSSIKGLNIIQLTQFHTAQKRSPIVDDVSYSSLPFTSHTIIDPHGYEYDRHGLVKAHGFGANDRYFILYDEDKNILYQRNNVIFRRYKSSGYKTADTVYVPEKKVTGIFKSSGLYGISETDFLNSSLYLFKNSDLKKADFIFTCPGIINAFIRYNDNEILIGSTHGLYKALLNENKLTPVKKINVKSISITGDGNIWVTTNKDGFFLFRNKKLIKMPLDEQEHLESAHYIIDDPYGYYWISSNNGLFKIPQQQLLQYAKSKSTPVFYYRFTKNNGLLTNEFNGGSVPNAYLLPDNEFVFPSMEGFVFFDPKKIRTHYPDRNSIFIERVKIGKGNAIPFRGHIILENDYDYADIFVDFPYYADASNLKIEARLENHDKNWEKVESSNQRKYTVRALAPGNYTLQIRVLTSPYGSYKYHTITFEIKPLFYQTKAFKIALLLLLLVTVILIIRMTTKFIRNRNKLLKRTVSDIKVELKETSQHLESVKDHMRKESEYHKKFVEAINHDITTPVKFIALLAQKISKEQDAEIRKEYFEGIHQTSEELYKFTLHLKEYNDLYATKDIYTEEPVLLNEILESKKRLFGEIARAKNNHIIIQNKGEIKCNINRNILACIIHNLIDNAVKYSENGKILLYAEKGPDRITIRVKDEGYGMSDEQMAYYNSLYHIRDDDDTVQFKNYGLGLHMVTHLIKKINAEIGFRKNNPKGTIVEINITLKKL